MTISTFAIAVALYSSAAVLLVSGAGSPRVVQIVVQASSLAGMGYMLTVVLGNAELSRLLVDVMLPTQPLKALAMVQVLLVTMLFVITNWMTFQTPAIRGATIALLVATMGILVSSFVLRLTANSPRQRRDNHAATSMLCSATHEALRKARASPSALRRMSRLVEDAKRQLGCDEQHLCPVRRKRYDYDYDA
jgi:hypothetical protein